jgi:hypothetical protein
MKTKSFNLGDVVAGNTINDQIFYYKKNGVAASLTGASIKMVFARDIDTVEPKLEMSTANSKLAITNVSGGVFKVAQHNTDESVKPGKYTVQLTVTEAGGFTVTGEGELTIKKKLK